MCCRLDVSQLMLLKFNKRREFGVKIRHWSLLLLLVVFACSSDDGGTLDDGDSSIFDSALNFDSFTLNSFVDGQQGWVDYAGLGQAVVVLDGTDANGTQAIQPMLTTALNQSVFISHVNDSNFSFQPYTGDEKNVAIQFDLTAEGTALLGLGHDIDEDGLLSGSEGEIGPVFGIVNGLFHLKNLKTGSISEENLGASNAVEDWYQIRLVLDFTAQDGSGSGNISYRNLSNGDEVFKTVPTLQNVDLQLSTLDAGPATWNSIWLHLLSSGSRTPSVDNLIPNLPIVVDP